MNRIGAHVAGGSALTHTLSEAAALGAEAVQVFLSSPHTFQGPGRDEEGETRVRAALEAADVHLYVHAPYVMNFGSPKPTSRASAQKLLRLTVEKAAAVGARGVVVHSGSSTTASREEGLTHLKRSLRPVVKFAHELGVPVLLEPMAGQGNMLASTIETVPAYLEAVDHEGLALCLDTAHLLAAGEPLDEERGMTDVLDRFHRLVGLDRLHLIHANDSKTPRHSKKDRHENIGLGHLHPSVWEEGLAHPLMTAPLILETPAQGYHTDLLTLRAAREV